MRADNNVQGWRVHRVFWSGPGDCAGKVRVEALAGLVRMGTAAGAPQG